MFHCPQKNLWTILCELNRYAEVSLPYFKAIQIFKGVYNTSLPKFLGMISGERGAEARKISASHVICKKRK
jgi:hypothetical protein